VDAVHRGPVGERRLERAGDRIAPRCERQAAGRQRRHPRLSLTPAHRPRAGAGASMRGVSLVEGLVSLVIVSVGAISAVGLQLVSKRSQADAGERALAAHLVHTMAERLRANAGAALAEYPVAAVGGGRLGAEPSPTCSAADDGTGR